MRVELRVDAVNLCIDTQNMELLARWLVEQFARVDWTPATWATVMVYPGWGGFPAAPDWLADSRIITQREEVKSPEDVVRMLAEQIERAKALG